MDKDILQELRKHAEENQVSLGTLLNQIVSGYMEWDVYATKAGYATIEKSVLKELVDNADVENLRKLAASASKTFKDTLLLMSGNVSLDAALVVLKNGAKRSGFQYRAFGDDKGVRKILIQHDMGEKWSYFYKERIQEMLKHSGHSAKIDIADSDKLIIIIET